MTFNRFNLKKGVMTMICLVVITTSAFGQRRKCPLEMYDGNWAYGTTETFYVGDPFDGIGQVEVMRPGKRAEIHEKNRKWTLDGVRIKPGEVFTKAGNFLMTIESNGYKTAYHVEVLPSNKPKRPTARVLSYPTQTEYKVGNRFYIDGIKVVCHDENGNEIPVEGKDITFFTSVSNTLVGAGSQCGGGYLFSTPGKKVIEVRYKYVTIGKYTINVVDDKSSATNNTKKGDDRKSSSTANRMKRAADENQPTSSVKPKSMANGWYNLRAMYNYLNIDGAGRAELRKNMVNEAYYVENKGNNQIVLRMVNGKYLGIADNLKDGVRIIAVSSPYLWIAYSENNDDIFSLRPANNTQMALNASGGKNSDGTHIILWTYTSMNAPNHADFRLIPTKKP